MIMKRLLIDASSIIKVDLFVGKDSTDGYAVEFEDKVVWINSAVYGYRNFMISYPDLLAKTRTEPHQTVLVLDGRDSRALRRSIYPEYKAHRADLPKEQLQEYYKCQEMVENAIKYLGGMVVYQDGMEADDVLAYLALNLDPRSEKYVVSRDKDMLALQNADRKVHTLYKAEIDSWIHPGCPPEYTAVYKALIGDPSDGFKGAKGFGEKAFADFVIQFGVEEGLSTLKALIENFELDSLEEDVDDFKPFRKILDSAQSVYISYALAKFYPERVNTSVSPLQIEMRVYADGDPDVPSFPSMLKKYERTLQAPSLKLVPWIKQQLQESEIVGLDIETTTGVESDAWVAAQLERASNKKKVIVDVFGSRMTGMSLTFGCNMQHTVYMPVNHLEGELWTSDQVLDIVSSIPDKARVVIHNAGGFELPVLYNEWGGWIENVWDSSLMKSHVDENTGMGLKFCSEQYLKYLQATFDEVTQGRKMDQLSVAEVLKYACDDAICCSALYNRFLFTMELEDTLKGFEDTELEAQYWVAAAFIRGVEVNLDKMKDLERDDLVSFSRSEKIVHGYLMDKGWDGTTFEPLTELTAANIKLAYRTLLSQDLDTRVRNFDKLAAAIREQETDPIDADLAQTLADLVDQEDLSAINDLLAAHFSPQVNFDSNKTADVAKLMYEVMSLPIRFRRPPTEVMRDKGIHQGNVQADFASVEHALKLDLMEDDTDPNYNCLLAVREMKAVRTRFQLYYEPYKLLVHWKDGKLHPQLGQSRTATRRFAPNNPNLAQLPKRKDEGKIRGCFEAPPGYIWASLDWAGQELRLAAEESGDEAMTSCYVGDNKRDVHSLTGVGIALKNRSEFGDYESFEAARAAGNKEVARYRDLGKATNFSSQYLCQAPKLAKLLVVETGEAQIFLDAKNSVYHGLARWQQEIIREAHANGYVTEMLGGRRHLQHKLSDPDKYTKMEAERQAVNYKIQGSGATMVKRTIASIAKSRACTELGAILLLTIHDEADLLVPIETAPEALMLIHECMIQPYAEMKIPLESELSIGWNFGELKKVGVSPTPEKIKEVIDSLP
jgi:DNA polymerase I-like protein with 3'-5' exonuclease and polymerase domains/5'-3' exonuclease